MDIDAFRANGPANPPPFQNVLLVRLSAIGDVVDCLPALSALHKGLPGVRLTWLVEDRCADLLRGHPFLDDLVVFPRKKFSSPRPAAWPALLADSLGFYAAQRHRRFDALFDFHGNFKSGLHGFLGGATRRFGFTGRDTREGNTLFTTEQMPETLPGTHRVDRNLALVRWAGVPTGPAEFVLSTNPAARERVEPFVEELRARSGRVVLLNPHASPKGVYKRWPRARWEALATRIRVELGGAPAVLWGPGERGAAEGLVSASGAVLAPPTSLAELIELFRMTDLLVGSDSGPLHMAWAAGTPVVALFGPKDPAVYGPYGGRGETVYLGLDCSPCRNTACSHVRCMEDISTEQVFDAVVRVLKRQDRARYQGRST
jgi:lipopolysaccharide heptosyltransferase I